MLVGCAVDVVRKVVDKLEERRDVAGGGPSSPIVSTQKMPTEQRALMRAVAVAMVYRGGVCSILLLAVICGFLGVGNFVRRGLRLQAGFPAEKQPEGERQDGGRRALSVEGDVDASPA